MPTMAERREFLSLCATAGLGGTLLPGVLWAKVADGAEITAQTIAAAEELAGVALDDTKRALMLAGLKQQAKSIETLHAIALENSVAPALVFNPEPPALQPVINPVAAPPREKRVAPKLGPVKPTRAVPPRLEDLAFIGVTELGALVRTRKVSSVALTQMYLDRFEKFEATLMCAVTVLKDRAIERAKAADEEIARGIYRSPLHGIPWGAKDLLAVAGAPTTWGATPFKTQTFDTDATVVRRLDEAGAVLIAKLSLGELAMGDKWFGGMTRNPWKTDQGSSGSSAGPGSAVAAGLVPFAIGSETLGSISSPATRNGVTGLRPSFGRVPRTGAMALSWSMDKLGPMGRSAADCAAVLAAIHGPDGVDLGAQDRGFSFDAASDLTTLRVGYVKTAFDAARPTKKFDDDALTAIRELGVAPRMVELPDFDYNAMRVILTAEGAAAFDWLTRSGGDAQLVSQDANAWPTTFRIARFLPAVDYINANRVRTLAIRAWAQLFRDVDVIISPTQGPQLTATNLTGHPAVIVPNGFRDDGTPVSMTFIGALWNEGAALRLAHAYQSVTDWHLRTPLAFR